MGSLTRKQRITLVVVIVGTFVTVLNQTLITPALPSIMKEMSIDAATGQWLTTGFTLVNAIMIPITAYLQDRFSTKTLFIFSTSIFAIGTLCCALGFTFGILLAGRLIQAAGAGILMPLSMTVLLVMFPIERRGSAMGIFGLVVAFAPAIGPTVAGIMVDRYDWHIMFYGVTGLILIVILFACILMEKKAPLSKGDAAFDALSVVLSTLGFGGLLYGFSIIGSYGIDWFSGTALVVGIACVVWFFIRQTHLKVPMLRVQVLLNRKFLIATIIGMLVQGSLLAAGILMPIYIQDLLGYPATVSGLVLMPGAIIMGIMNPVAGKLFDKHGPRVLGIVGMVMLFLTTIAFGFLTLETSLAFLVIIYALRMLAMTLVNMPITTWGMNALETKYMNHGTSVNNTLRQVAGSLGTAIVISSSSITTNIASPNMDAMHANLAGINVAFLLSAVFVLVGLVLTIVFVKGNRRVSEAAGGAKEAVSAAASKVGEAVAGVHDEGEKLLRKIMKTDVFELKSNATVQDAMQLFIDKGISACPVVDDAGDPVGFISDGDILKMLAHQTNSFMDPIALIATSAYENTPYDEKLNEVMGLPVVSVGAKGVIGVSVHSDLSEVCRVLANNHLKKVPVLDDGKIVGIINRSDITKYSMQSYLGVN